MIPLTVYGTPAPQGSKRAFAVRGKGGVPTGRVAVVESSHYRVKSWRQAVVDEARKQLDGHRPLTGPLSLRITFYLPRPKGHYGTGRNSHLVRPGAPAVPAAAPDLSKLLRATEDAMTDAGLWGDDGQVVICAVAKRYADDRPPGAIIHVRPVDEGG